MVHQICLTFSRSNDKVTGILDKSVALSASKDITAYQGIQAMDWAKAEPTGDFVDTSKMSDDELAYHQAKERGELTEDERAYFEFKGFDCSGIGVAAP